jgi:hypothetical protein
MEIILACCIIGLFSFWVWNLKHDVEELQKTLSAHPDHEKARIVPEHAAPTRVKWENGVPTWTIE